MVTLGIEALVDRPASLAGDRVGLITNPSAVDPGLNPTLDLLDRQADVDLVKLFAPEHGIRGDVQAGVNIEDSVDEKTGLPVKSLYGNGRGLTPGMLEDVDAIVYDMQDIGCRFYTLIYTLANALHGVAAEDRRLVVLDRPNPIAPLAASGNRVDEHNASSVGDYGLPITHRMTVGELARFFNGEYDIDATLDVVPLEGWSRDTWYDETGLPWVNPSPNMPSLTTATLYPGTCFFEGTTLSEGRGTTKPFELVGAPWVDADRWAEALDGQDIDGVGFRPAYFTPMFSKHERKRIEGVQVHVLDRESIDPVTVGLTMLVSAFKLFPEADWLETNDGYFVDKLAAGDYLRKTVDGTAEDASPADIVADIRSMWQPELEAFDERREQYTLY
jgi:beta-N-acetylhexosaminidase